MLIALLSDTHDNVANTRAALDLLRARSPAAYLHAGDMCDPEMIAMFAGLPFHFVFGNNDFDHAGLRAAALAAEVDCMGDFGEITLAGKRIAIMHGDDLTRRRAALSAGKYDYLISGHTHYRADARSGKTRTINPGALHRASEKTVALLDLATDTLETLIVTR